MLQNDNIIIAEIILLVNTFSVNILLTNTLGAVIINLSKKAEACICLFRPDCCVGYGLIFDNSWNLQREKIVNVMDADKQEMCRQMWRQHSDELKKMCERKLSSCRDEIDDVIADAFYYLCVNVFEGNIHTNTRSWLFAVTNNLIKKKYTEINKRKQRHISFSEADMEQYDCCSTDDTLFFESKVSESIIDSMNIEIIDNLSPAEQQLYKYVYEEDLSLKEIAARMNLTYGAVKERNHRLGLKIKVMVKEHIESMG